MKRGIFSIAALYCFCFAQGQNVGIGTTTPNGRLQFNNHINNRIVVLNESGNNEHNFFGFGINEFTLRYQVADPLQSHVFFAGNAATATASNELMRIRGDGNVGINQPSPNAYGHGGSGRVLEIRNTNTSFDVQSHLVLTTFGQGGSMGGVTWATPNRAGAANSDLKAAFIGAAFESSGDGSNALFQVLLRNGGALAPRFRIGSTGNVWVQGNVGINVGVPNAPLQLANDIRSRKLVLFDMFNNDHQFFGMGINTGTLRYQVAVPGDAHVFFAGTSANTSAELMRITGTGNVGIGQSNPQVPLQFATALGKKISLFRGPLGDAGFGVFGNELRIHSDYNGADITFGYDDFTNGYVERFRMRANGALSVAGNAGQPGQVLTSSGASAPPVWSAAPGAYNEAYQSSGVGPLSASTTLVDLPGLVASFSLPTAAKVVFQIRTDFQFNFCIACPPNQTDFVLQRVIPGGTENAFLLNHATPAVSNFSSTNTFVSGPLILNLPAGSYTYKVAVRNNGPGIVFVSFAGGLGIQPGVLTWQIYPN
jgi:hypothetical protein